MLIMENNDYVFTQTIYIKMINELLYLYACSEQESTNQWMGQV